MKTLWPRPWPKKKDLEAKLDKKNSKIDSFNLKLNELTDKYDELVEKNEKSDDSHKNLMNTIQEWKNKFRLMEVNHESSKTESARYLKEIDESKTSLSLTKKDLETEKSNSQQAESERSKLGYNLKLKCNELSTKQSKIDDLTSQASRLQENLTTSNDLLSKREIDITNLEAETLEKSAKLKTLEADLTKFKNDKLPKLKKRLTDSLLTIDGLKLELQSNVLVVEEKMQLADSKCMAMNSMKDGNEKLQQTFRAQNDALRLENLKLEKHAGSAGRELEKLKADILRLNGKNSDARAKAKELENVVDHLNHDLMSLKKSSGQYKTTTEIQLNDLQEKYMRVQQSESSLSIQVYDFQSKIEELNEEIIWREEKKQERMMRIGNLEKGNARLGEEKEHLKNSLQDKSLEFTNARNDADKFKSLLEELEREKKEMKDTQAELEALILQKEERNKVLEGEKMKKVSESKALFSRLGEEREEQTKREVLRASHRESSRVISGGGLHQSWAGPDNGHCLADDGEDFRRLKVSHTGKIAGHGEWHGGDLSDDDHE